MLATPLPKMTKTPCSAILGEIGRPGTKAAIKRRNRVIFCQGLWHVHCMFRFVRDIARKPRTPARNATCLPPCCQPRFRHQNPQG